MSNDSTMQTLVQINMYRMRGGQFEYLLLKRIDQDDKFWQPITEKVTDDSTIAETVKRAAIGQAGVHGFKHLSKEMHSYEWYAHEERGRDIVFAAEVSPETPITTDTSRYSTFAWLPYEEAVQRLKWNGNKEALKSLHQHLEAKRVSDPTYWQTAETGLYGSTAGASAVTASGNRSSNPYGDRVPKRLPDRPEDSHQQKDDDEEVNTGEWFL